MLTAVTIMLVSEMLEICWGKKS